MLRNTVVVAIALLMFIGSSCKKKKNSSIAYNLKGTVNNADFNGTGAFAVSGPDSILNIYGGYFTESSLKPPYVVINLCPYSGVGVYTLATPPVGHTTLNFAAIDSVDYYQSQTVSASGTVTITATSPAIRGSFTFTAIDATQISGTFVAKAP